LPLWLASAPASAERSFALHAEGAAAGAIGDRTSPFGWGGSALVAAGLRLHPKLGVELPLGFVSLRGVAHQDPAYLPATTGSAVFAVPGLRVRPFANAEHDGPLWIAGGAGIADTGGVAAPAVDLRVGLDVHVGTVALGPFAGLLQLVNVHGGVRPGDARLLMLGVHGAFQRAPPPPPLALVGDRDHDGIRDDVDRCPDDPEDVDGFQDSDGCPDLDNDKDGIPDAVDRCPDQPETVNGLEDDDGCPDRAPPPVVAPPPPPPPPKEIVTEERIKLPQLAHFARLGATIAPEDTELIADVAAILTSHPEYVRVRLEGHTDEIGSDGFNARLSRLRAEAVQSELVHDGVSAQRIEIVAFGRSRPLRRESSSEAQRENRRVEFEVVRRRIGAPPAREEDTRAP
jgi:outer membrane protein OmpA-like peptidoglycan-associated protein